MTHYKGGVMLEETTPTREYSRPFVFSHEFVTSPYIQMFHRVIPDMYVAYCELLCALYDDPLSHGLSHAMMDLIIENDPFALKQQRGATEQPIRSLDHIHGTEHELCQPRDCFQTVLFRADADYKAKWCSAHLLWLSTQ